MFKRLYDWTKSNRSRFGEIGVTFTLVWLWVMFVLMIVNLYGIIWPSAEDVDSSGMLFNQLIPLGMKSYFGGSVGTSLLTSFIGACVLAPLMEETFRAGLCELCSDKDGKVRHVFLLLAGSFLGFGLLHGGGYRSIFIQGTLGLLLGRLWFRTNRRADGTVDKAWAYCANVFVHAAYNFCIMGLEIYVIRSHMP